MDQAVLGSCLEHVSPVIGQTLTVEQKASIQTSLNVLKRESKFDTVKFLGRLSGSRGDYLLAQGFNVCYDKIENAESLKPTRVYSRKNFYSINGVEWRMLPNIDNETVERCSKLFVPFSGDPASKFKVIDRKTEDDGEGEGDGTEEQEGDEEEEEEVPPGFIKRLVKEEERVAYVVARIDNASSVVPRGALLLTANDEVVRNPSFAGLSGDSASDLTNYMHLRTVQYTKGIAKLGSGASENMDFLEPVSEDVPRGCWSAVMSPTEQAFTLRHLVWPGAMFFHVIGTPLYGNCYFGDGLPNPDVAFML